MLEEHRLVFNNVFKSSNNYMKTNQIENKECRLSGLIFKILQRQFYCAFLCYKRVTSPISVKGGVPGVTQVLALEETLTLSYTEGKAEFGATISLPKRACHR